MTMSQSGDIRVSGASGDISLQLAVNDSPFEFITISGTANGEVSVSMKDGKLDISGNIENYTVKNTSLRKNQSDVEVSGEDNAQFVIEDGQVVAYIDKDGDGIFETKLENAEPTVVSIAKEKQMKIWILGSEGGLVFENVTNAAGLKITVDNTLLSMGTDYSIQNNVAVLNAEFLNKLEVGLHKLETNNGYCEEFVVAVAEPTV